ncbi:Protein kinase-like domain superfamily [Arabidopsis suecica]|uniref:Protein kinase-like domain superfamily n=1 Tax=Arabidopsis suecica TaxID=45249 RepID=A0A8T1ZYN8_ARASU|nr:Protein kinase-like domain superfamily [Arabidopsis suecica]
MLRLFRKKKKKKKKKQKKEKEINFQKNGSLLLEELIATSGGIYNPIRTFSSDQILQATNHFDWNYVISEDRFVWYKGMIENRPVLFKKFQDCSVFDADNFYRDIAVSSLMSSHKNVLKLLGCCLEFPRPVLVCAYPENGALNCIRRGKEGNRPFPWNVRLRIAKEIADAVAYLHTEFPRTIIHRDLKLANIFLDENWSAKLSSFSLGILIPEGETGVNDMVCRTSSYIEPNYFNTGLVTENVDIYSLGIIMLVLLTGKSEYNSEVAVYLPVLPVYVGKFLERGLLTELIDPSMFDSASDDIPQQSRLQMEAFIELAFRCVRFRPGENVPRMIDVAKELKKIEKHT